MYAIPARRLFARIDAAEHGLCLRLNRGSEFRWVRGLFVVASRLGDGVFWYSLMLVLPLLFGADGIWPAIQMALTGLVGVGLYKWLKRRLVRERPYISLRGVQAAVTPLDRYSFPSGHTLHAFCMTLIATSHFPALGWLLWPFTLLVAGSRPVLGLHYPTDVLAGAGLGALLAGASLTLV
jgi:undecaprenyl-diphosphatase